MKVPFLNLGAINRQYQTEFALAQQAVLDYGWFIMGPQLEAFEKEFAAYCEVPHAVGVANGLDALILILKAMDIGPGDEVIVPTNTYIATWLAASHVGATPVGVEPNAHTYNLDPTQIEKAITPRTKAIVPVHLFGQCADMERIMAIAKKHKIPTMIDMAADVPPVSNLWKYNDLGFDLVCVSGGKAMCGPQSAGILMGKKELIAAARLSAPPRGGNIGRGMKVNKEEILGMYVALEKYINQDHDAEWKMWESKIDTIVTSVNSIEGVTTEVSVPPIANHTPLLFIKWDESKVKTTNKDLMLKLRNGSPSIEVMANGTGINITVFMLQEGEEKIVAKRVREELLLAKA